MQPNPYLPQPYPTPTPAPQYPAAYPQQYPGQPAPQYAPPAYPAAYPVAPATPPAPPAPPSAPGTLDGFYGQPATGGGKAWSFHNRPNGTTFVGIVARPINDGDIQQQTDLNTGALKYFKDGRPMFVMIVPLLVPPSPEHPDGVASWWVRGQARDDLVRAMAEAGAPAGPPEAGAGIQVTKVSERPGRPGFNPSYVYHVVYTRPTGAATVPAPQAAPAQPVPPAAPAGYAAMVAGTVAAPAQPAYPAAPPAPPAQPVYAPPAPQYAPPVQAAPAPQVAPASPGLGGLTPEQQALMAQLTGTGA